MTAERREPSGERPDRLHRLDRLFTDAPVYFVTTCTEKRQPILANDAVHNSFVDFATRAPQHGAWVGA